MNQKEEKHSNLAHTFALDDILSVTVKAFRKVIGYDTFDSILRKDRNETKDPNDYYNVTVSMMIKIRLKLRLRLLKRQRMLLRLKNQRMKLTLKDSEKVPRVDE